MVCMNCPLTFKSPFPLFIFSHTQLSCARRVGSSPKRAAVNFTTKTLLVPAHGRLPGGSAPICAAAQLYPRCRLQARIDVLLRDFLADDVPLADRPLSACSLALVLLLTLALAFDFVIISRCSVALDLYLGLRHDVQQQQEQQRTYRW